MKTDEFELVLVYDGVLSSPKAWSGIPYYLASTLQKQHADTHVIDSMPPMTLSPWIKLYDDLGRLLRRKGLLFSKEPSIYRKRGREIRKRLDSLRLGAPTVILAIGMENIAYLSGPEQVFTYGDSVFGTTVDYYPGYTCDTKWVLKRSLRCGKALAERSVARATQLFLSSEWALKRAKTVFPYSFSDEKFRVVKMGANLADPGKRVRVLPTSRSLRFLFVGNDWHRKGGATTVETCALLRKQGWNVELDVVGSGLRFYDEEWIRWHGNLDKANPGHQEVLHRLFLGADIFMLPTLAECFGAVFCEAAAYALPAVAASAGGVPEAVRHLETGILLPPGSSADQFASAITETLLPEYNRFSYNARRAYEEELNWDVIGETMLGAMMHHLRASSQATSKQYERLDSIRPVFES